MTLQPIMRTAQRVATLPGEFLPHLFTLAPYGAVVFCYAYLPSQVSFPLGSMALCVARTFLPESFRSDKPTCCMLQK